MKGWKGEGQTEGRRERRRRQGRRKGKEEKRGEQVGAEEEGSGKNKNEFLAILLTYHLHHQMFPEDRAFLLASFPLILSITPWG